MDIFSSVDSLAGSVKAPVKLFAGTGAAETIAILAENAWAGFPWEDRGAPRRECFFSDIGAPYTYGSGAGARTYWPKPAPDIMASLTRAAEAASGCRFELCFANGYAGEREHLGWHADDSPEIDDARPIAVMSLGAAREIWVKPRGQVPMRWRRSCCPPAPCSSWARACRIRTSTVSPSIPPRAVSGSA